MILTNLTTGILEVWITNSNASCHRIDPGNFISFNMGSGDTVSVFTENGNAMAFIAGKPTIAPNANIYTTKYKCGVDVQPNMKNLYVKTFGPIRINLLGNSARDIMVFDN